MLLPELPESKENKTKESRSGSLEQTKGFPELPDLDSLDSFIDDYLNDDELEVVKLDKTESANKTSSLDLPELPVLEEDLEDFANQDDQDDLVNQGDSEDLKDFDNPEDLEGFEDSEDQENQDYSDDLEDSDDFEDLEDLEEIADDDDFQDIGEDWENEDDPFLQGVSLEGDDLYEDSFDEPEEKQKKGFRELNDDSVKNFFLGIKDKIMSEITRNGNDTDKKYERDKKELPRKKGKINKKAKEGTGLSKGNNKIPIGFISFVAVLIAGALFLFTKSSPTPLNEIVVEASAGETLVSLENFVYQEVGLIGFDVKNQSDISADFYLDAEISGKTSFIGSDKFSCESDIVSLETGAQSSGEILRCEDFNPNLEHYKIKVKIIELYGEGEWYHGIYSLQSRNSKSIWRKNEI